MKLYDAFKIMLIGACLATVFQLLFISIFAWLSDIDSVVYSRNLYQLLLVGILSTLPTLILVRKNASQLEWIFRQILHFILTASIVLFALVHFGWVYAQTQSVLRVFLVFLIVYTTTAVAGAIREKKLADKLNERINASHNS